MTTMLRRFIQNEQGQDLTEYSLLLAFAAVVIFVLANGFHDSIAGITSVNNSNLTAASEAALSGGQK